MHKLSVSVCKLNLGPSLRPLLNRRFSRMVTKASVAEKNIAVIGSSRGIGLEFVRQLLSRGNTVHATARRPEAAKELQNLQCDQLTTAALDIASPDAIKAWAAQLKGKQKFDYVFNIAGVSDTSRAGLQTIDTEKMLHCFQTNTIGPLILIQQLLENGLLGSCSTIANMTSKMGSIADNGSGGSYAYRSSKVALNQVTKSLSIDLEDQGITCVLLHPGGHDVVGIERIPGIALNTLIHVGWVRTDMTNQKGLISVEECVSGLINVLETEHPLNGRWFDFKHDEIPW